jgi:hypothetical protein
MFRTLHLSMGLVASAVLLLAACGTAPAKRAETSASTAVPQRCFGTTTSASRIPPRPNECATAASPVRSWSSEEIDRTGATDAANALRLLDPSVTVHH